MTKAYSYLRFSTPEQAKGDSHRRQFSAAQAYADEHGLELDTDLAFHDLGVSAFRGANADEGRLGDFRRAIEAGHVEQGSYLLVESLDRISRQSARKALHVLEGIIDLGVTVVTLSDRKHYTSENLDGDHMNLMLALLVFMRGHEESAIKSQRLKAVYEAKRQRARAGDKSKPFTRRTPAWIEWSDEAGEYRLIHDRAEVVRKVYEWTDEGIGKQGIASKLNIEGVAPFEDGVLWHKSYVHKLLNNPSCAGFFIPKRKEEQKDGKAKFVFDEPIADYFPAAVPQELYERIRAREATSKARGISSGAEVRSVVAGVTKCGLCGSTMTRVTKGKYVYLVCTKAHAKAGCEYLSVPYENVEKSFRVNIDTLVNFAPKGGDTAELEGIIRELEDELDSLRIDAQFLLDQFRQTKNPLMGQELEAQNERIKAKGSELIETRKQRDARASRYVSARLEAMREAFKAQPFSVPAANQALRACIKTVKIDPRAYRMGIEWHAGSWDDEGLPLFSRHQVSPFEPA